MNKLLTSAAIAAAISLGACERKTVTIEAPTPVDLHWTPDAPTSTLETKKLGAAVDNYVASPTDTNAAQVKKTFADLDGEIAELEERVAKTTGQDRAEAQGKLTNLQTYRAAETARFSVASVKLAPAHPTPVVDTRAGAEKVGDGVENAANKIGRTLEHGAENVGDKIHDVTH